MKRRLLTSFLLLAFCIVTSYSQSYFYGGKIGLGLNSQKWNTFERDMLFTPLVDLYLESYDGLPSRVYGSLGYHTRGSAVRGFGFTAYNSYRFNNIVAEIGGKRMATFDKKYNGYYMLGLRGEYTVSTNLNSLNTNSLFNLVSDEYIRKLNYGVTLGGGFEYTWTGNKILFFEISINPDLSKQYEQLDSFIYTDPNGINYTIRPQEVRNLSLEFKIGLKFLSEYEE